MKRWKYLFLAMFLVGCTAGCAVVDWKECELKWAKEKCQNNDGLRVIVTSGFVTAWDSEAICNNGAIFEYPEKTSKVCEASNE